MDHLDLMIAKKSRKIGYTLCTISGKTFGKESARTALVPKKPVALSGGIIDGDQIVVESAIMKNKNKHNISTYKTHNNNEDVRFCDRVIGNTRHLRLTILIIREVRVEK